MVIVKHILGTSNGRRFETRLRDINTSIFNEQLKLVLDTYEIDEEGAPLIRKYPDSYKVVEIHLTADNSTQVHPTTGAYWNTLTEQEKEGITPVGEWDFFWYIVNNVPVLIINLITNAIEKNKERLMPKGFVLDNPQPVNP